MFYLTKHLVRRLQQYPLYSQSNKEGDAVVICKYFSDTCAVWYILEGSLIKYTNEQSDWRLLVFCREDNLSYNHKYVMLSELQKLFIQKYKHKVKRDISLEFSITLRMALYMEHTELPY